MSSQQVSSGYGPSAADFLSAIIAFAELVSVGKLQQQHQRLSNAWGSSAEVAAQRQRCAGPLVDRIGNPVVRGKRNWASVGQSLSWLTNLFSGGVQDEEHGHWGSSCANVLGCRGSDATSLGGPSRCIRVVRRNRRNRGITGRCSATPT